MEVVRSRSARWIANTPGRLYRALPSVVLGTLFNVLDTVSTGLLIFPSEEGSNGVFQALQIQGLSMYIMSTILSQVAMTLGGSRFPGALGAMLIEILPFLRGIGSDIRDVLGPDNPSLVPTVFAAYAMTSFLIGFAFIVLGLLKLGNLVAYFPQTVLTGAIGAIGLSLFILGLGLMLPPSSPALTLSSAGSVLFKFLSPPTSCGFIPSRPYLVGVHAISAHQSLDAWYVGALHCPRDTLVTNGWLFRVDASATRGGGIGTAWIYWREFDFHKVEWWAMKNAIENIVLLVVIGVLNLPIYVPALAFSLNVPYDMNHEFFGQGAANILAGIAGTAPNILQYSYSVFFTRANGGRFEAALVTLLTFVLFLTSGLLLPYVPTVLASALVLFLGIELLLEAVWESAKTLVWLEWSIVVGTLMACTFLGFAEGFGVGIGAAIVVYFVYGVVDSRARVMKWEEWNETHMHQSQDQEQHTPTHRISPLNHTPSATYPLTNVTLTDIESGGSLEKNLPDSMLRDVNARVVVLSGYVYFATIPSLESQLLDTRIQPAFVIVDLSTVHRLETAAAQCFQRAVRDLAPRSTILVLCGVQKGSGVHADFDRAGVDLTFDSEKGGAASENGILSFRARGDALTWCERQSEVARSDLEKGSDSIGLISNVEIYRKFCKLFDFDLRTLLESGRITEDSSESIDSVPTSQNDIDIFVSMGAHMKCYTPGQVIARTADIDRIVFFVEGHADIIPIEPSMRPSFRRFLLMLPEESLQFLKRTGVVAFSASSGATYLVSR
ncbi:sulfate transporter family-domain-containing protein [Desarmillaria tabescens]|uniref:Sulfate transporter family-domain-containing protein n=1 Tax=Armillaria tabescens TaxID=1929756 RepID=A0AA39JTN8_ARMTA|nr:sulfate transporter family-domain-containing protein [Desarmillaria tabescens]KAK0448347.1 sulfate transporter family-domain-containing protein [Desarmillaria tabescens]